MTSLTGPQLRDAASEFLLAGTAAPSLSTDVTASKAELSKHCREAQNALRAAVESADSALLIGATMNRMLKTADGKEVKGTWATPAQDSLRAAVLFAGAGLDRSLKRLAEDAIPVLVAFDDEVNTKLSTFAETAIAQDGTVDPKQLVAILLNEGTSPREILVRRWLRDLTDGSAQSAERVSVLAGSLGVTDKDLRKRMEAKGKTTPLELAFVARNEIAHELDVTKPQAETRARLERIRRTRSLKEMRAHVVEMLDVAQLIVNDVAGRLAANGYS